jgi:hypothetical protein
VVTLCASDQAQPPLIKADADRLEKKLAIILERGAMTGPAGKALRTTVTDREVNSYFKFQGAECYRSASSIRSSGFSTRDD